METRHFFSYSFAIAAESYINLRPAHIQERIIHYFTWKAYIPLKIKTRHDIRNSLSNKQFHFRYSSIIRFKT